jgi:large subunit ribosomal protein L21
MTMFAVIKTGGKQYRVVANDEFEIERLPGEAGDSLTFTEVLMLGTTIGAPFVAGASVTAEIVEQTRGPKVISFKKRRRQNSKRTRGHRQDLTLIRIGEILGEGQTASEKPVQAAKVEKTEAEAAEDKAAAKAAKDEAKAAKADAKAEAEAPKKAPAKPRAKKTETVADAE